MTDVLRAILIGWDAEPMPLALAAAGILIYVAGARRLAAQGAHSAPTRAETWCLGLGVAVILIALTSPLDALTLQLQWAHMVQHLLLLLVAPPLVVLARPVVVGSATLSPRVQATLRRGSVMGATAGRRGGAALVSVLLFVVVLWLWHVPTLYDLTLRDQLVHDIEHTTFLGVGLLFWAVALPRDVPGVALGLIGRSVVALSGLIGSWLLAVYIGYAPVVLYAYRGIVGLSTASDQQLAAGIMWVPGSVPFVVVLIVLVARWFDNDARTGAADFSRRSEARP